MPRAHKKPVAAIALSPAKLAAAFGLNPSIIYREISEGHLTVRTLPGTLARRIDVDQARRWLNERWVHAKPKRSKHQES